MIPDDSLRPALRQQQRKNSITSPNLFRGMGGIILAYQHGLPWLDALNGYLLGNAGIWRMPSRPTSRRGDDDPGIVVSGVDRRKRG